MNISIKRRIYWSFLLLVLLFMINGVLTILTLSKVKKISTHLSSVVEPSLQYISDFNKMMLESKMYTTNWVFLRSKQEDKDLLGRIHDSDYQKLKSSLNLYTERWANKNWVDSLDSVFVGFEQLLVIEEGIMKSLSKFKDYDDPVTKLDAELKVEDDVLPRTEALMKSLNNIYTFGQSLRDIENRESDRSSSTLTIFIIGLAATIICLGFFLSKYMTSVIISPVDKMIAVISDLGKGITRKIDHRTNGDEIGKMVNSVNNLSKKLLATATFAHEVGIRNFDVPFQPLSDEDTLGKSLMTMRDNLKEGEIILELKNNELERKNKELEQFAYIASHDLQEPLRTTSGFAELLQKRYHGKLDEKADTYLSLILSSSERMKVLIKDLLDYSRIGRKMEKKQVDCNLMIHEVLADLAKAINEGGAKIKSDPLPVICGYPTEIKQLFQNLLVNAIKFKRDNTPPQIKISAKKESGCWQFSISDNGIGIEEQYWERIFIIFQRLHTRTQYEGSGIGLAHCRKIVELHDGKIWIRSIPGTGTTFYFTIPENNIA